MSPVENGKESEREINAIIKNTPTESHALARAQSSVCTGTFARGRWLSYSEPADLRIIGTSIQFGHQHNGWESWTNFPSEIRKMVDLIKETRAGGVVFVSGDVHWAELSVLKAEGCYPLHDLTASGINRDWDVLEPNRNRVGEACMDHHFGQIEIDWSLDDPVVTFGVQDVDQRTRLERKVALSALKLP
ncbi:MAG: hypothetical protein AAF514_10085 [Verrucomicrobiota bacterium]